MLRKIYVHHMIRLGQSACPNCMTCECDASDRNIITPAPAPRKKKKCVSIRLGIRLDISSVELLCRCDIFVPHIHVIT
jgi:hypothetical protein